MKKNWLEWSVFALGLVLIAGVSALLLRAHLAQEGRPPAIVVTAGTPVQTASSYAIPLDIANDGDRSAEDIRIEVVLSGAAGEGRTEITVPLLPYGSRRRAWIQMSPQSSAPAVRTRVISFAEP
jgi:uncharacterized protein (TIGR02588 family)